MSLPELPTPTLFVAATALEARLFARDGRTVRVLGMGKAGVRALHELLHAEPPGAVVAVGVAGALDASLEPGAVVLTEQARLAAGGESFGAAGGLLEALATRLDRAGLPVRRAGALTVDGPLHDPELRDYYARRTGCAIVDMESARWAACAAGAEIPYAALRVVSDRADLALPDLRHRLLRTDGRPRWLRWGVALLRSGRWRALRHEWDALRRAREDWRAATAALARAGAALGSG